MSSAELTIALPQTLRQPQVMTWLAGLRLPAAAGQALVIDASPLISFDSSALACLIEVRRRVEALGGRMEIRGLSDRLQRLAQVYGLADLL
mgnify:FL=1